MTGSGGAGETTVVDVRKRLDTLATHLDGMRASAIGGAESEAVRRLNGGAPIVDSGSTGP